MLDLDVPGGQLDVVASHLQRFVAQNGLPAYLRPFSQSAHELGDGVRGQREAVMGEEHVVNRCRSWFRTKHR